MRNGLETRNGVGGEGHARYGYPSLPPSGRSKSLVSNKSLLGLCITLVSRLLIELAREQKLCDAID
jgi:hypothetical protein